MARKRDILNNRQSREQRERHGDAARMLDYDIWFSRVLFFDARVCLGAQ